MAQAGSPDPLPSWLSVSGEELYLDNSAEFLGDCTTIDSFEQLNQLGEGTYGVVHRAKERASGNLVALKQIRMSLEERQNGTPITALREISILRSLKHVNIVNVLDVAVGDKDLDEIYMVMEYAEQVGNRRRSLRR
ncbi:Cdc2- kinase [Xylographa trunciseda]|nr:Cdc2- kinase [Xylographa trunciseda]